MKCKKGETNSCYRNGLALVSLLGLLISIYAFHVETKQEEDSDYEALCDINEHISCTKVFGSKYGRGMGFLGEILGHEHPMNQPNGLFGVFHYSLMLLLSFIGCSSIARLQVALGATSVLMSFYLAYLLAFVLHDFCVVCVSMYVVNFASLYFAYGHQKQLAKSSTTNSRSVNKPKKSQ